MGRYQAHAFFLLPRRASSSAREPPCCAVSCFFFFRESLLLCHELLHPLPQASLLCREPPCFIHEVHLRPSCEYVFFFRPSASFRSSSRINN
ncbi:hypothetical protein AAZX31_16G151900 [Glycine max]